MAIRLSSQQVVDATGAERVRVGARASYHGVCTDSRAVTAGCLFVALKGERFDAHDFLKQAAEQGAAGLVVQKGRGVEVPDVAVYEVEDTLQALGRLARFHRDRFRMPLGAVTGSNGKTTTKELIASILETRGPALKTQGNLNNEVGVPLTLFNLEPKHVAAIIEMGMNHLGEIARLTEIARPHAGLVTTVQPAHLEGLGSIEGVGKAKGELFWGLAPTATAVVNVDEPLVAAQATGIAARTLTFGRAQSAEVRLRKVEERGRDGLSLEIEWLGAKHAVALPLIGAHNAMNATGAFAMGVALGYAPEACVRGLEAARPYARRLQVLDGLNGVTVIDDCYNANPSSMTAALQTLKRLAGRGRAIAVVGDMLELGANETSAHQQLVHEALAVTGAETHPSTSLGALGLPFRPSGVEASSRATTGLVAFFGPRTKRANEGTGAPAFLEIDELKAWLLAQLTAGDTVLVKGSRGMRLERVVEALVGPSAPGGH